jgi:lipopolysaccharide transport system ATP-binding protein
MAAIVAEDISKRYRINVGRSANTLVGQLLNLVKRDGSVSSEDIWALRDVSFQVEEGEVFGIIGRNGSGKSTLLKILTGIARPTYGSALVRGRVGALLEVGTGFHPDLTGRENVFFNGALLGLDRASIKAKFDEIVAFAEVEKFIDTQFKHYSSGMQARLGFAVAVNLRPEVLILDEVLSVGDMMFQEKSMDRMTELRQSGMTILFVSHSLSSIAGICRRAMLLKEGRVVKVGEVDQVVEQYIPKVVTGIACVNFESGSRNPACFLEAQIENEEGERCDKFDLTDAIYFRIRYSVKEPLARLRLGLRVHMQLEDVTASWIGDDNKFLGVHDQGIFEKRLRINPMFLKEGEYSVTLEGGIPTKLFDQYERVLQFSIVSKTIITEDKSFRRERSGKVICQGKWSDISAA